MCYGNFDLVHQEMGGLKMIGSKGGCNAGISGAEKGLGEVFLIRVRGEAKPWWCILMNCMCASNA